MATVFGEDASSYGVVEESSDGFVVAGGEGFGEFVVELVGEVGVEVAVSGKTEELNAGDAFVGHWFTGVLVVDTADTPEARFAFGFEMPFHYKVTFDGEVYADAGIGLIDEGAGTSGTFEPGDEGGSRGEGRGGFFFVLFTEVVEEDEDAVEFLRETLEVDDAASGGGIVLLCVGIEATEGVYDDKGGAESADFGGDGGEIVGAVVPGVHVISGTWDFEVTADIRGDVECGVGGVFVVYVEDWASHYG